jgi:phosphoglycerol transferase MdoB-like AlkP superfamily enzyme
MMSRLFEYLHGRRGFFRWLFFALLILIPVFDFTVERHNAHFFGDTIPGFWSLFGLLICLGMVYFWKWLAHTWLERDEDYYDS